ncbi:MAG: hypothetical protein GX275_13105 [Clostridiales bacterium]|nr:hypothetical protein [Clostridiales bacterium]
MRSIYGLSSLFQSSIYSNYSSTYSNSKSNNDKVDLLSNYSAIKNGSYKKLLNNYYSNIKNNKDEVKDTETINKAKENLLEIKDSAKVLKLSYNELRVAVSNTAISERQDHSNDDTDTRKSLISAVKKFTEAYNTVLDKASEAESNSILNTTLSMTKMTRYNKVSLSGIGINVGSDNKLSVDEKKLKEADMASIKNLFYEYGSYGDFTAEKADKLNSTAIKEFTKTSAKESLNYYSGYFNSSNINSAFIGNFLNKLG